MALPLRGSVESLDTFVAFSVAEWFRRLVADWYRCNVKYDP